MSVEQMVMVLYLAAFELASTNNLFVFKPFYFSLALHKAEYVCPNSFPAPAG